MLEKQGKSTLALWCISGYNKCYMQIIPNIIEFVSVRCLPQTWIIKAAQK